MTARQTVPISASQMLTRPLAHLDYLEPPVRAHFVLRVVLVGAESTGKTTLARKLAAHYRTAWVPEYARPYWDGRPYSAATAYSSQDLVHIAQAQQAMEDMLARHANRVLNCDTNAFTSRLWHEWYMNRDAPAVREVAARHRHALHILAGDEIPWEDDGTRDQPERRHWFQGRFREEQARSGWPFIEVVGSPDERLAAAAAAIDRLLASGGAAV